MGIGMKKFFVYFLFFFFTLHINAAAVFSTAHPVKTVAVITDTGIEIAINYGSFATVSGAEIGDPVSVEMLEKGGYAEEYAIRQLERSDNRDDYASNVVKLSFGRALRMGCCQ